MHLLRSALAVLCVSLAPFAAMAQEKVPLFDNYLSLRATLDAQMKNRDIAEVMVGFGSGSSLEEHEDLEARVRDIFPRDFENAALLRRQEMENGWRQEMIAYWTGVDYIYVYLLLHKRDDGLLAVTMRFNTDFDELNAAF